MAVTTTDTYSGPYLANGVTVEFPFTFKAASADELRVVILDAGNEITVDPAAYTASLATVGGKVTFYAPPVSGDLYIESAPSFTQKIAFSSSQAYRPETVNEANDRAAVRDLYLKSRSDRAFTVPFGEAAGTIPPLATRAGKIALYGFDGGLEAIDTLGINNSELTDDGLWNPDDEIIDDGEWG